MMPIHAAREQRERSVDSRAEVDQAQEPESKTAQESRERFQDRAESLAADLDDVVDEIDAILEENLEHLENYAQMPGE